MTKLFIVVTLAVLAGCAARPQYQWGGYDELLYRSYQDPAQVDTMRTTLEKNIVALEQSKQRIAPGLYAELGTLYLQKGDAKIAKSYYAKERDAWPESKRLMNVMIKNVERKETTKQEASQ